MKIPSSVCIGLLVSLIVGSASGQNPLNGPQGVVYDLVSHRMLLTNFTDGTIVQVDANHQQSYAHTPALLLTSVAHPNPLFPSPREH